MKKENTKQTRIMTDWPMTEKERFVIAWQRAKSIDEVVEATQTSRAIVLRRASYLRQKGVVLKLFRSKSVDFERLKELATRVK